MNLMKDEIILEQGTYTTSEFFEEVIGDVSFRWSTTITTHRIQVEKRHWWHRKIETIMLEDITSFKYVKPSFVLEISLLIVCLIIFVNIKPFLFILSPIQWLVLGLITAIASIFYYLISIKRSGLFISTASRVIKLYPLNFKKEKELISIIDKLESAKNERYLILKK
jgi:hypothetical protein